MNLETGEMPGAYGCFGRCPRHPSRLLRLRPSTGLARAAYGLYPADLRDGRMEPKNPFAELPRGLY